MAVLHRLHCLHYAPFAPRADIISPLSLHSGTALIVQIKMVNVKGKQVSCVRLQTQRISIVILGQFKVNPRYVRLRYVIK